MLFPLIMAVAHTLHIPTLHLIPHPRKEAEFREQRRVPLPKWRPHDPARPLQLSLQPTPEGGQWVLPFLVGAVGGSGIAWCSPA